MNRLALMLLKNIFRIPRELGKLWHYAKHTDEYPEEEKYRHIQHVLNLAIRAGNVDLQVHGRENIPQEGGFLMYGNHQGLFDVLAVATTCDRPLGAVFKKELANVPIVKQIIACTKSYAMDREDVRQSLTVIQAVTKEVENGRNYLIFPEGTRSRNGNGMNEFHPGSFRCAVKSGVPIVPLALIDCYKVLDQKGSKPVTVQLHYLPPITREEYQGMKTVELATLVQDRIRACIEANA